MDKTLIIYPDFSFGNEVYHSFGWDGFRFVFVKETFNGNSPEKVIPG